MNYFLKINLKQSFRDYCSTSQDNFWNFFLILIITKSVKDPGGGSTGPSLPPPPPYSFIVSEICILNYLLLSLFKSMVKKIKFYVSETRVGPHPPIKIARHPPSPYQKFLDPPRKFLDPTQVNGHKTHQAPS